MGNCFSAKTVVERVTHQEDDDDRKSLSMSVSTNRSNISSRLRPTEHLDDSTRSRSPRASPALRALVANDVFRKKKHNRMEAFVARNSMSVEEKEQLVLIEARRMRSRLSPFPSSDLAHYREATFHIPDDDMYFQTQEDDGTAHWLQEETSLPPHTTQQHSTAHIHDDTPDDLGLSPVHALNWRMPTFQSATRVEQATRGILATPERSYGSCVSNGKGESKKKAVSFSDNVTHYESPLSESVERET